MPTRRPHCSRNDSDRTRGLDIGQSSSPATADPEIDRTWRWYGVQRKGLAKEIEWTRHGFDNGAGTKITDTVAGELPSDNDLGKEFVCNINEWKRFIVFE